MSACVEGSPNSLKMSVASPLLVNEESYFLFIKSVCTIPCTPISERAISISSKEVSLSFIIMFTLGLYRSKNDANTSPGVDKASRLPSVKAVAPDTGPPTMAPTKKFKATLPKTSLVGSKP